MKNLLLILLLAFGGWYGYGKYEEGARQREAEGRTLKPKFPPATSKAPAAKVAESPVAFFTCDGRSTCVQMTSCEEARFFMKSCPGMSPEGNRQGTSCEKQWCSK